MGSPGPRFPSGNTMSSLSFPPRSLAGLSIAILILFLLLGIHSCESFFSQSSVASPIGGNVLSFATPPCWGSRGPERMFPRRRRIHQQFRNHNKACDPIPSYAVQNCGTKPMHHSWTKRGSFHWSIREMHVSSGGICNALFSQSGDNGEDSDEECRNDNTLGESVGRNPKRTHSFASDFAHGFNHVHKNFLALSGTLYLRTIAFTAPFILILFVVLPSLVSSPSYSHQALALSVQCSMQESFTFLANASMRFYLRPLLFAFELATSMLSAAGSNKTAPAKRIASAWGDSYTYSAPRKRFYLLVLLGPVVEEIVFRWGFCKLWKALFRPLPEISDDPIDADHQATCESNATHPPSVPEERKHKKSWYLFSGAIFAVTHLVNFFPLDVCQYSDNVGNILLPRGSFGEQCLVRLFPGDAVDTHRAFCLVSMVLYGAIFQGMHCFINTMILYGPLFETRGLFAAIGAHMAWNTNVLCLVPNIKLRLIRRLWKVRLSRLREWREWIPTIPVGEETKNNESQ